jgi:hypothetical protein
LVYKAKNTDQDVNLKQLKRGIEKQEGTQKELSSDSYKSKTYFTENGKLFPTLKYWTREVEELGENYFNFSGYLSYIHSFHSLSKTCFSQT